MTISYFKLKPIEKIKQGWLTWNDNQKYQHQTYLLNPKQNNLTKRKYLKYRIDIQIKGLIRWIFRKPLDFKKLLKNAQESIINAEQLNPSKFYELKKKGRI